MRRHAIIALVSSLLLLNAAFAEEHQAAEDPFLGVEEFVTIRTPQPIRLIELPKSKFSGNSNSEFSRLPSDSTISIHFESRGCFHDREWELKISGGANAKAQISDADGEPPSKRTWTVALSAADLVGLDRLLDYYRSPRSHGCTTTERVVFRWKEQSNHFWERRAEEFDDDSCGMMNFNNILWLWDLVLRSPGEDAA